MPNKALDQRHPIFQAESPLWRYYRDSYEGGPLYPSKPNPLPVAAGGAVAITNPKNDPGLSGSYYGTRNYLWQYPLEQTEKYAHRLARAVYVNLVAPIVDYYSATVGKPESALITPEGTDFVEFLDDADLQGQSFAQFLASVRPSKTVSGCDFILVDMPAADAPTLTMRQQKEQGLRPYVIAIRREDMLNWRLDQFGKPIEILFRHEAESAASVLEDDSAACVEQLRYWSRDSWVVFQKSGGEKDEWIAVANGVNTLGQVPIVPMYHVRLGPFRGESLLKDAAKFGQLMTNWVSSFDENLEASMFPVPVFKSTKTPTEGGVGAATIMHLNPEEGESFEYVSPDSGPFEAGWRAFALMCALALRHMGIQGKQLQTQGSSANDAQSGVSKEWDFAEAEKVLANMAAAEEDAVKQILYLVGLYLGSEWKGTVQYARKYDLSSATDMIANLSSLQAVGAPLSVRREILARATVKILTSLTDEKRAELLKDIEKMKDVATEMPAPGGGGFGGGSKKE